jgi:hypothetical protein
MEQWSIVDLPDSCDAMLTACQNCAVRKRKSRIEHDIGEIGDTRRLTGVTVKHDATSW